MFERRKKFELLFPVQDFRVKSREDIETSESKTEYENIKARRFFQLILFLLFFTSTPPEIIHVI